MRRLDSARPAGVSGTVRKRSTTTSPFWTRNTDTHPQAGEGEQVGGNVQQIETERSPAIATAALAITSSTARGAWSVITSTPSTGEKGDSSSTGQVSQLLAEPNALVSHDLEPDPRGQLGLDLRECRSHARRRLDRVGTG